MRKSNRFRNILLVSFAVIFIAGAGIGKAWAYFTTYATAKGGYAISFEYQTEIEEKISGHSKIVTITNRAGSQPVYIRAKALSGEQYPLEYTLGDGWTLGTDGWYYYNKILNATETTSELKVEIKFPEGVEDGFEFNVVVVYESTLVKYDQDGHPYADWDETLDTGTWEGGSE